MEQLQAFDGGTCGQSQLTEVLGMIEELHNVANLCRNEGATDIAYMLDTAADMIDALKGLEPLYSAAQKGPAA